MTEELERYKEGYRLLQNHITAQVALGHLTGLARSEATAISKLAAERVNPPPEFEEVEIIRWSYGSCMDIFDTEEGANCNRGILPLVKFTATVKRPVRRAVIREYEVAAKIGALGDVIGVGLTSRPFLDQPECHGKAGVLIFRTAE